MSNQPLIIDTFPYNGEPIVIKRIQYLYPVVDKFVLVEARKTHSGKPKEFLYVEQNKAQLEPYADKLEIQIIDRFPPPDPQWLAEVPPNFTWMSARSHDSWWREMYQREVGAVAAKRLVKDYPAIMIVSDADEIPRRDAILYARQNPQFFHEPVFLDMQFHYYSFQWLKKERWCYGFLLHTDATNYDINMVRVAHPRQKVIPNAGWHCSYFLDAPDLRRKIESFAHREVDRDDLKTEEHLRACLEKGVDIAGRGPREDCIPTPAELLEAVPKQLRG